MPIARKKTTICDLSQYIIRMKIDNLEHSCGKDMTSSWMKCLILKHDLESAQPFPLFCHQKPVALNVFEFLHQIAGPSNLHEIGFSGVAESKV